jgi:GT2 family glycosyltransferase
VRSDSHKKQNELLRSLQRQLAAKEQELAGQKWLFERFLDSPSWRLTSPIRWLARQLRALRALVFGERMPTAQASAPAEPDLEIVEETDAPEVDGVPAQSDAKDVLTRLQRAALRAFLSKDLELPHSESPEISILLVLYNRAELTFGCLLSIAENRSERLEVIIVDNASSDETGQLLNRLKGARIFRNTENRNFLLSINQAAQAAAGEYLLILNNDTQLLPGTLQSALKTIRSAPDIGAVGARLILPDGSLQEAGSIVWRDGSCLGYGRGDDPSRPMYMFQRDVDYCSGAFLLTPRTTWQRFGGFDETYKPAYYEETDYCTRLWENGLRVVYDPNAALLHYEFASSSTGHATDLQREHRKSFLNRHRAALQSHYAPSLAHILDARMKCPQPRRLLFIDDRVPHRWLGSGFPRTEAMLQTLVQQKYFVTFYPMSAPDEDWTSVYSDMPREIEFMMRYGPQMLETFLRSRAGYYDTIIISRPHNMAIFQSVLAGYPAWFEKTKIVYDAEALFAGREIELRRLAGSPLQNDEVQRLVRQEVRLASAADCVVSVSEAERAAFLEHGVEKVYVVGHAKRPSPTPRPFRERNGLLFVGAIPEEASPNEDSMIWFLEEVFPAISAALGNVRFTIAGINQSARVRELAGSSVTITGHLPDLTHLYDASRVFVAPTRYAAGIPHKVHEAAANGLPVVATPLLASQLGWEDGTSISVAADAKSFAHKCIELHTNEDLWLKLRQAALKRIAKECSPDVFEERLKEVLASKRARRAEIAERGSLQDLTRPEGKSLSLWERVPRSGG